jgi:hypothetical protein
MRFPIILCCSEGAKKNIVNCFYLFLLLIFAADDEKKYSLSHSSRSLQKIIPKKIFRKEEKKENSIKPFDILSHRLAPDL